uniref:Retrovirus-related Pol polyprotein from transposon TNT 1-94 n=1 Tax=Bracon brevicornis TaxID=1563983 RepID=A0A6V7JQH2_9HYME
MRALLIKNNAWQYVSGTTAKPEVVGNNAESIAAAALWETSDAKASSDIILCIDPKELKQVKNCSTSKEIWEKLKNSYQSTGPARKGTLLKQLALSRLENGGDVKEHCNMRFLIGIKNPATFALFSNNPHVSENSGKRNRLGAS